MDDVMEGTTAGDPMSAVKWTRKSTRAVSRILRISHTKAWKMLRRAKYRLRFNRKRLTRRSSPDRNKQFTNINKLKDSFAQRGQPVISVDAKKRELVGLFKNQGRAWRKAPVDVDMYDFPSDADGVAIPYGIYDVTRGDGFVVVGTSHNTPAFAANAIHTWWRRVGRTLYSTAKELLILADSGSSNGARAGDWKHGLQEIANKTGLRITVAHYPTGASKWNPVEHRLFGPISINWAGEPLVDYHTICQRIRHTRTRSGACCRVALDRRTWPTKAAREASGKTVAEPLPVKIRHGRVVPRLNYTIVPASSPRK
jgi:DDE family transposase